jgi:hypothetical protein
MDGADGLVPSGEERREVQIETALGEDLDEPKERMTLLDHIPLRGQLRDSEKHLFLTHNI